MSQHTDPRKANEPAREQLDIVLSSWSVEGRSGMVITSVIRDPIDEVCSRPLNTLTPPPPCTTNPSPDQPAIRGTG